MASHVEVQVAPATARNGVDMRNKGLTVACNEKQELACEDCGEGVAEHSFSGVDGKTHPLCGMCNDSATAAMRDRADLAHIAPRAVCVCEDCGMREATEVFIHLYKGRFNLCDLCFSYADHEDVYPADADVGAQDDDFTAEEDAEEADYEEWEDQEDGWGSDGPPPLTAPTGSRRIAAAQLGSAGVHSALAVARGVAPWFPARFLNTKVKEDLIATVLHPSKVDRSIREYGYNPATEEYEDGDVSAW